MLFFIFLLAEAALTAVAGDILAVAGKAVDGEETVVGTSLTSCQLCVEGQRIDLFDGKHGGLVACLRDALWRSVRHRKHP